MATIPQWDDNKVLPPIRPDTPEGQEHESLYRAPYVASLEQFVTRFATTPERIELANKFLDYRGALYQYGISEGFQWINGSFVENIEGRAPDHRQPKDIDVVTFFYKREDTREDYPVLFNPSTTQLNFNVDAYGVELGLPLDMGSAALIGFWHGLWSHRRDHVWKGFIQVALDPGEDPPAKRCLDVIAESEERR